MWRHLLDQTYSALIGADGEWAPSQPSLQDATQEPRLREAPFGHVSLPALIAIKKAARRLVRAENPQCPSDLASALYFMSIAAALVHCKAKITSSEKLVLDYGFRQLLARNWLGDDTHSVLRTALQTL